MHTEVGDLWEYHSQGRWVVVPTNIGWKADGSNVMGRGVPRQAAQRFLELPHWYGVQLREDPDPVVVYRPRRLVLFAVKPLDREHPWLSWRQPATLEQIEASVRALAEFRAPGCPLAGVQLAMPMVGCGNGQLDPEDVLPILERELGSDEGIVLVRLSVSTFPWRGPSAQPA